MPSLSKRRRAVSGYAFQREKLQASLATYPGGFRSKGKNSAPIVASIKPELKLELGEDDSLRVTSHLTTSKGIVVEKPASFDDMIKDDGWFSSNDNLYRVKLTGTPLDKSIFSEAESITTAGADVPRLFGKLKSIISPFLRLRRMSVWKGCRSMGINTRAGYGCKETEHRSARATLAYYGKDGKPYQPPANGLAKALSGGGLQPHSRRLDRN